MNELERIGRKPETITGCSVSRRQIELFVRFLPKLATRPAKRVPKIPNQAGAVSTVPWTTFRANPESMRGIEKRVKESKSLRFGSASIWHSFLQSWAPLGHSCTV
jgi:hypothetical protein